MAANTYNMESTEHLLPGDVWTIRTTEFFIEEIKNNPELWDPENPLYKMRNIKRQTYSDLAKKMQGEFPHLHGSHFNASTLIHKFKLLRTIYKANVKKYSNLKSSLKDFNVPWIYFRSLQFLDEIDMKAANSSNVNKIQDGYLEENDDNDSLTSYKDLSELVETVMVEEDQFPLPSTSSNLPLISSEPQSPKYESNLESVHEAPPTETPVQDNKSFDGVVTPSSIQSRKRSLWPTNTAKTKKQKQLGTDNGILKEALITPASLNSSVSYNSISPGEEAFGRYIACKLEHFKNYSLKNKCEKEIVDVVMRYIEMDDNESDSK